jgi:nucleotide-binding universal stress UspA family protein
MIQPAPPFARLLVPFDGSEPALAALQLAIAIAQDGAAITVMTVVDEEAVVTQSATTVVAFDPTPLFEALDQQAHALLADARVRCSADGITAVLETVHDAPVAGIVSLTDAHTCDLVIMGTHARQGVARAFIGSTTEGVLRSSQVPVLTVRAGDLPAPAPFSTALVAIDDSEPADAAAAVAAKLARAGRSTIVACHAIETDDVVADAVEYRMRDAACLANEMQTDARALVRSALARAALAPATPVEIIDGAPVASIISAAQEHHATLIIAGTHGRRGLRRLFLGSVAEQLVRTSTIPVLIVPMLPRASS